MNVFHPTAELTKGLTLLEASAGTGKTYTITSLVLQLVGIHHVPLREILLVTFTRNATAELRERVRKRLVNAIGELSRDEPPTDDVVRHLIADGRDRAVVLSHLRRAVERFDECVIRTIHGFCQRMLQEHAPVAGVDVDLELEPNAAELVEDLVDDWLSRALYEEDPRWHDFLDAHSVYSRDTLVSLAKKAVDNPDLLVTPPPTPAGLEMLQEQLETLRQSWAGGWSEELVQAISQAHADKRFAPRQRTYTAKTAPELVDEVSRWLVDGPLTTDAPKGVDKLLALPGKVVEGHFDHPAIAALGNLTEHASRHAAGQQARFIAWVRDAFERTCRRQRIQPYAELVRSLANRVGPDADANTRTALTHAIGGAFQAALIDEFQDTDNAQWTLFREVFGQGAHWLYLIGDPKQAIYRFRGANVHVYLAARQAAGDRVFTMTTNWRSDPGVLTGLNYLMGEGDFFAGSGIDYVPVTAPDGHGATLTWLEASEVSPHPVQLATVDWTTAGLAEPPKNGLTKDVATETCARVAAQDIVALLQSGATLHTDRGARDLTAADIAVLVRTGGLGDAMQQQLRACGVPSVQTGRKSVLASAAAQELQRWLAALVHTGRDGAARAAGTTGLFGYNADLLIGVQAGDASAMTVWDEWLTDLARWRDQLERHGFLRALRSALADHGVHGRILSTVGGERYMTDLLHAAELVHTAQQAEGLHGAGVLAWLARARQDASSDDDAEIRLERDDDAVTIMTIHKSKGLEFPVVVLPFLWHERDTTRSSKGPVVAPGASDATTRVLDLRGTPEAHRRAQDAETQELRRLAYVALTRAASRLMVYSARESGDETALTPLIAACETAPDAVHHTHASPPGSTTWSPPTTHAEDLRARRFVRHGLDRQWRRYSYTALTRNQAVTYAVPEDREGFDPDRLIGTPLSAVRPELSPPSDSPDVPLAGFPAGARAGIFLHEVFELIDFQDAAEPAVLLPVIERLLTKHAYQAEWAHPLAQALSQVLLTPLGGPLGNASLSSIPRSERFDELRFDFPLAGGDDWGRTRRATVRSSHIVQAIQLRQPDSAMRSEYMGGLGSLRLGSLAGFMTGSIDLVFRAGDRWFVADYKSNRIDPDQARRYPIEHFALAPMRFEMEHHHYYLQYHLYTLALHRYLRHRVPDYDYDTHMGGVYYLFFRGMVGPDTPSQDGVVSGCFYDRPPAEVIHALDVAFEARETP